MPAGSPVGELARREFTKRRLEPHSHCVPARGDERKASPAFVGVVVSRRRREIFGGFSVGSRAFRRHVLWRGGCSTALRRDGHDHEGERKG